MLVSGKPKKKVSKNSSEKKTLKLKRTRRNSNQVSVAINSVLSSQTTSKPLNCNWLMRCLLKQYAARGATA